MADNNKKKLKIFQDEIKLRHTTHWDLDAMSRAELEAYMQGNGAAVTQTPPAAYTPQAAPPISAQQDSGNAWTRFMRCLLPGR